MKYIVVGSVVIEYKIYSGSFSKAFSNVDVWLSLKNWMFLVDVFLEMYVLFYL